MRIAPTFPVSTVSLDACKDLIPKYIMNEMEKRLSGFRQ